MMGTNAVIDFSYGDGSDICSLEVRTDGFPGDIVPKLKVLFEDVDGDNNPQRLNWDYMVSNVVSKFIRSRRLGNVRLLPRDANGVSSYTYDITPLPDIFCNKQNMIELAVQIDIKGNYCRDSDYIGSLMNWKL